MSRGPDVATLLGRAIEADACRAGCDASIETSDCMRWASATFAGARHRLTLSAATSIALDRWIAGLPDTELSLRGHIVADLDVTHIARTGESARIELAVLTVED